MSDPALSPAQFFSVTLTRDDGRHFPSSACPSLLDPWSRISQCTIDPRQPQPAGVSRLLRAERGLGASSEAAFGVLAGPERGCVRPRCACLRVSHNRGRSRSEWTNGWGSQQRWATHGVMAARGAEQGSVCISNAAVWSGGPCENPGLQPTSWDSYHGLNGKTSVVPKIRSDTIKTFLCR